MKFLELFLGEIESIPEIRIVLLSDKIEEAVKDQILFLLIIYGEDWIEFTRSNRIDSKLIPLLGGGGGRLTWLENGWGKSG